MGEEIGLLLQEALDAKAREVGGKYSHRDLERDSGVNYSYVSKAIHGAVPSKAVIRAWAKALAPHLPLDDALIAAGHLPDDPTKRARMVESLRDPLATNNTPESLSRLAQLTDSAVAYGIPIQDGVHAGDGGEGEPLVYETSVLLDGRHVSLRVRGTCMEPDIREGEVVIGFLDGRPDDGMYVIAEIDGQAEVRLFDQKRRQLWTLDGKPATPLGKAGAIIPVVAVQRALPPKRRKMPGDQE